MYEARPDRSCYAGTSVLRDRLGLRDQDQLDGFEAEATAQRAIEPLPDGRLTAAHYRAIHRHLFQDVYPWAGRYRRVRMAKGASMFCYPENIAAEMRRLFAWLRDETSVRRVGAQPFSIMTAHFLAELNAIHPFREGNGRTQLVFLTMLASRSGFNMSLASALPGELLDAMIASFQGNEAPLAALILSELK